MAKDKKQKLENEKENKNKEKETVISIIGLIVFVFALLVIVNTGIVANAFRFAFISMFGTCYLFVVLVLLFMGLYMIFKKKAFNPLKKVHYVLILFCFVCILALSSVGQEVTISNFTAAFKKVMPVSLTEVAKDNIVGSYGGGWLGYLLIACFNTLLGSETWSMVVYIILLAGFMYLLFRKPIHNFFGKIKKRNQRKKEQKAKIQKEKEEAAALELQRQQEQETLDEASKPTSFLLDDELQDDFDETQLDQPVFSQNLNNSETPYRRLSDFESVIDDLDATKAFTRPTFDQNNNVVEPQNNISFEEPKPTQSDTSNQNLYVNKDVDVDSLFEVRKDVSQPSYFEDDFENSNDDIDDSFEEDFEEETTQNEDVNNNEIEENEVEFNPDTYKLPPLYLLKDSSQVQDVAYKNEEIARKKADILTQKMQELNVNAAITNYVIGPSVTRYEIMLQPGVRANAFLNLQEDFKLALGATSLRVESPIPGKPATIGIEVPNDLRGMVTLKDIIMTLPNKKEKLFVPAGKAISGEPISISITSMPHCLISGATNSGKSVCANSIICSLLLNYKPNEVKMIMVDPKRVEMLFYTNLPHLMCPIITETGKALVALDKLSKLMMKRFDTFAALGVKNIATYNEVMRQKNKEIMPFILLIVDEFAELMAHRQSGLVEERVQSLVQLGRAAGIHLILCTQRPSVNVITGTIKNNIPCRMTFRLSSFADSKTVIDGSGAEKLLNNGDMLLLTPDFTGLRRIQGAYVSDKEIDDIVDYCKKQSKPLYDPDFMDLRTPEEKELDMQKRFNQLQSMDDESNESNDYNAKFNDVRYFVLTEQRASTSLIQRKFKIGYGKAANYVDMLEDEGIVGPENGSKGREVLMTYEEWESKNGPKED